MAIGYAVMAGLDPAIHVFGAKKSKSWMPASSAGMTKEGLRPAYFSDNRTTCLPPLSDLSSLT